MAQVLLSMVALYNYDDTVLNDLSLPSQLDRANVIDNLLMETAELEVLYPDPVIMKAMIKIWSKRRLKIWQDLYDSTVLKYNPIWNKDGTVKEIEKEGVNRQADNTETRNLTGTRNETRNLADSVTHSVYGYNSSTAAPESSDSGTNTGTDNFSLTDSGYIKNNGTGSENRDITRERIEQGNIGVTSTQELIRQQRLIVDYSVIEKIIADFKHQFCMLVY